MADPKGPISGPTVWLNLSPKTLRHQHVGHAKSSAKIKVNKVTIRHTHGYDVNFSKINADVRRSENSETCG